MNQSHVLLLFKFPEYDSEYFMPYSSDEIEEAKRDGANFKNMYPGALYVTVIFVHLDEREDVLWRWTNPLAEKLTSLANSAGGAIAGLLTTSASAPNVGNFFQKLSAKFSDSALLLRPPSEEASALPLPSLLKTYGGRNRRTRTFRR